MSIWEIIGIISSLFGIYSFIKNDTPLFPFLKKSIHIKILLQNINNLHFSFLDFVFKKSNLLFCRYRQDNFLYKKNLNLVYVLNKYIYI